MKSTLTMAFMAFSLLALALVPTSCGKKKYTEKDVQASMKKLDSDDWKFRKFGAMELGDAGPIAAPAVPKLIELLDDKTPDVRRHAKYALGSIGEPAVGSLIKHLNHDNKRIRKGVMAALTRMGPIPVLDLADALKHKDKEIRKNAAKVLEDLGPDAKKAIPVLKEVKEKDESWSVRHAAKDALRKINRN